jgi:hypothetical protein
MNSLPFIEILSAIFLIFCSVGVGYLIKWMTGIKRDVKTIIQTVDEHGVVVKRIIFTKDMQLRVEEIVRDALYYIPTESLVMSFVVELGELSKETISFIIDIGLDKITREELTARFISNKRVVSKALDNLEPAFSETLAPLLDIRTKRFSEKVHEIQSDGVMNSKTKRFTTEAISCIQDITVIVVKHWMLYSSLLKS